MIYKIIHRTCYRYSEPVTVSHHAARLAPRDQTEQSCLELAVVIKPQASLEQQRLDYFGNEVRFFNIHELHSRLDVTAQSRVEVRPREPVDLADSPPWESVVDSLSRADSPELLQPYQFLFDSFMLRATPELAEYARPSFEPKRPFLEGVMALCGRIHEQFQFDRKATTVATPLTEVMRRRHGVCQDFAHVAIASLRSLGLPARYVSGYLRTHPPEGHERLVGADASHAWFSVFCPRQGWVDFDPTNNVRPGDEHITVSYGRDFADVSPLIGILTGGGNHEVTVAVDVELLEG